MQPKTVNASSRFPFVRRGLIWGLIVCLLIAIEGAAIILLTKLAGPIGGMILAAFTTILLVSIAVSYGLGPNK